MQHDNVPIIKNILKSGIHIIKQLPNDDNILQGLKDMFVFTTSYRTVLAKAFSRLLDSPELLLKGFFDSLAHDANTPSQDRHFRSSAWQKAPFKHIKDSYENVTHALLQTIQTTPRLTSFDRKQCLLFIKIFFEFIAPYNHLLFHPDLLKLTQEKKGANLLKGFSHFLSDLETWQGYFAITRSPFDAFSPGVNIALTEGHIIDKNPLYELICYPAKSQDNQGTPLLLATSWINKYYILDLKKRNSFILWLTEQGFHVYTLSWNMPNKSFRDYGFEHYVEHGILHAIETLYALYQTPLPVAGYCLGGTLLATAVAYLTKTAPEKIHSLSLFASMIDFLHAGQMKYLLGEAQIQAFEKSMQKSGLWHARKMAGAFCLADVENVYWPFYQRNYVQGEKPIAHELIYWAQDYTHIPEKLFIYYMRDLYKENNLSKPNTLKIHHQPINFRDIDCPIFCLGLEDDNLTLKKAAFNTAKLFKHSDFILSEGTHVSGMLCTAKQTKLGFYSHGDLTQHELEDWQTSAHYEKKSWWLHWHHWITQQNLGKVAIPHTQANLYPAPGEYVLKMFWEAE